MRPKPPPAVEHLDHAALAKSTAGLREPCCPFAAAGWAIAGASPFMEDCQQSTISQI